MSRRMGSSCRGWISVICESAPIGLCVAILIYIPRLLIAPQSTRPVVQQVRLRQTTAQVEAPTVRKGDGKLEAVQVRKDAQVCTPPETKPLQWSDVIPPLLRSRDQVQSKLDKVDLEEARHGPMKVFGYHADNIVDSL